MKRLITNSQCRACRHFQGYSQEDGTERSEQLICAAFQDGIPDEINFNEVDHRQEVDGDGGLRWEPRREDSVHPLQKSDEQKAMDGAEQETDSDGTTQTQGE